MNDLTGVQTSIVAALRTAPATYRVYDAVPQGVAKPYIVLSEWLGEPGEELGTVTTSATLQLDTWSATPDKGQTHAMLDFIRVRLDGQSIAGTWLVTEDEFDILEDPASTQMNRIYHAWVRYLIEVEDGLVLPPLGQFDMEQFA